MNFLVLYGPNMNLIGVRSAAAGERITLDKINRVLRRQARDVKATLKVLQTNDMAKAITFLQRNRNAANGIIIAPGPWARNGYELLDTIQLCGLPTVEVHFGSDYDPSEFGKDSILSATCISTKTGAPLEIFTAAFAALISDLKKDH